MQNWAIYQARELLRRLRPPKDARHNRRHDAAATSAATPKQDRPYAAADHAATHTRETATTAEPDNAATPDIATPKEDRHTQGPKDRHRSHRRCHAEAPQQERHRRPRGQTTYNKSDDGETANAAAPETATLKEQDHAHDAGPHHLGTSRLGHTPQPGELARSNRAVPTTTPSPAPRRNTPATTTTTRQATPRHQERKRQENDTTL